MWDFLNGLDNFYEYLCFSYLKFRLFFFFVWMKVLVDWFFIIEVKGKGLYIMLKDKFDKLENFFIK